MCGIVGGIGASALPCLDDGGLALDRAIDCMHHRGPDGAGRFVADDARSFLGHRRLSIIDLDGGAQPIRNERGDALLCYNGEIYNFRELQQRVRGSGHTLRTESDGEPALHLYEDDPSGFEGRLSGMFGLAVLDTQRRRLTLVRDRLGIKPLYYYVDGARLYFASELKSLLALMPAPPPVSRAALRAYLRWKYIPAPDTVYDSVFELPPGHRLVADIDGARVRFAVTPYWRVQYRAVTSLDERDAVAELDARLRAAVRSHLESDVEVGALLSGGVDSSLVVAIAAQLQPTPIRTFSVGFREPGFDQLPEARQLAQHCRTSHYEELVDLDPIAAAEPLARCYDQPFGDSSALACYAVCRSAARRVKVALTGDGGDETFAGYQRYAALFADTARPSALARGANTALFGAGAVLFSPEAKFLRRARAARHRPAEAYEDAERTCSEWLIDRLIGRAGGGEPRDGREALRAELCASQLSTLDLVQTLDARTYLPGDILRKVDGASMAWSLECRVPLLDASIVEFSASLPPALRRKNNVAKFLLKKVAEKYVPLELIYRKKRGFRVPIRRWLKGDLLDRIRPELLSGEAVRRGILSANGVRWVLAAQRRPWMNLSSCLWCLWMLEQWARLAPGDAAR